MHVYVSCVDPIISLALLSSPVCLSRALCLLGAACPPKRLLQRNHFKNFTGSHIHTCTQTWAGSAEIGHGLLICDLDLSRHPSYWQKKKPGLIFFFLRHEFMFQDFSSRVLLPHTANTAIKCKHTFAYKYKNKSKRCKNLIFQLYLKNLKSLIDGKCIDTLAAKTDQTR